MKNEEVRDRMEIVLELRLEGAVARSLGQHAQVCPYHHVDAFQWAQGFHGTTRVSDHQFLLNSYRKRKTQETAVKNERRIYVVVPASVEVRDRRVVIQPSGRQIAQACHVVSKLRLELAEIQHQHCLTHIPNFPITTIILAARDQKEMINVFMHLTEKGSQPTLFADENLEVYGDLAPVTAMAIYATPTFVEGILDYLPLWGS